MEPGNPDLVAFVREKIQRDGPVTFAWFMEQALYHPQLGYYSSGKCDIGRKGDYFTNVSVGPLFGKMLAAQFAEMWEVMGRGDGFAIVEQGAHDGDFARDVLAALREGVPGFFAALQYWVLEPFPVLEARQRETLRDFVGKVTWWKSLDALPQFSGVHFSNELLDAMPVHLVTRDVAAGQWLDKFVAESDSGFHFATGPINDERLLERLDAFPGRDGALRRPRTSSAKTRAGGRRSGASLPKYIPQIEAGSYETEINLAALDWIDALAPKLRRGYVLAVDYGFPRSQFFAPERTSGTLQAYAKHRRVPSPLEAIGQADIAAHVEWTSLAERAENCGLTLVGFTDQYHFMTGMLTVAEPAPEERRSLQTLMHPEFLGTRFQYLSLGRDVPKTGLSGFRFARDARKALA